ncbi:hypothetical protein M5K25_014849 [Dendrobium thyrsiflorum]|uniref:Uncharacterized protein n=1 Tax=Dendrobium thyrsiflorum TaxID=117978 RepID=A0ABD0UP37_DENTH
MALKLFLGLITDPMFSTLDVWTLDRWMKLIVNVYYYLVEFSDLRTCCFIFVQFLSFVIDVSATVQESDQDAIHADIIKLTVQHIFNRNLSNVASDNEWFIDDETYLPLSNLQLEDLSVDVLRGEADQGGVSTSATPHTSTSSVAKGKRKVGIIEDDEDLNFIDTIGEEDSLEDPFSDGT